MSVNKYYFSKAQLILETWQVPSNIYHYFLAHPFRRRLTYWIFFASIMVNSPMTSFITFSHSSVGTFPKTKLSLKSKSRCLLTRLWIEWSYLLLPPTTISFNAFMPILSYWVNSVTKGYSIIGKAWIGCPKLFEAYLFYLRIYSTIYLIVALSTIGTTNVLEFCPWALASFLC